MEIRPSFCYALEILPARFGNNLVAAEIGVLLGVNADVMLQQPVIQKLILIDPYAVNKGYDIEQEQHVDAPESNMQVAHDRLQKYGDRVQWIQKTSITALCDIADNSLDYCYIDGDHRYEAVAADIAGYYHKVKSGGILAGHDYHQTYMPELHAGVTLAVDEYFAKINIPIINEDIDWWIVKP